VTQLPKINELVLVRTGSPESVLRSRVEDAAPGVLTIAHPSDGLTAHRLPTSTRVTLEWLVERGIGTVTGVVSAHVDIGIPALTVQLNTTPVVYQRREHARADLVLEVAVWPSEDEPLSVPGVTLDISGGGFRAVIPVELEPDSLVRIEVELPEGAPIEALARVVAQREDGVVAFQFHEIVPNDRERMIRAVFASYRIAASVRRTS
jgi:c-di-GMP-binding flagellar brake protein YcgR